MQIHAEISELLANQVLVIHASLQQSESLKWRRRRKRRARAEIFY